MTDIYDGADWTEIDIEDLKAGIAAGRSVEEAAAFLCRADSIDVSTTCDEGRATVIFACVPIRLRSAAHSKAQCRDRQLVAWPNRQHRSHFRKRKPGG
jgi:hypothetical protein